MKAHYLVLDCLLLLFIALFLWDLFTPNKAQECEPLIVEGVQNSTSF